MIQFVLLLVVLVILGALVGDVLLTVCLGLLAALFLAFGVILLGSRS